MTAYQIGYITGKLLAPVLYMLIIGTIYYFIKGRRIPFRQAVLNKWVIAASLVLFLLGLVGSGLNTQQDASHVYPEQEIKGFMSGCVDSAKTSTDVAVADKLCSCAIAQIQQTYTYGEFKALANEMQKSGVLPTGLSDIMLSCARQHAQ
ncbi:MAG: hypothetical protein SFY66_07305 [Oculatellaceae cyanobacterium bins.114]|nr:hypothetical protein [Oculatellaceae cyanobacterium bins.114]